MIIVVKKNCDVICFEIDTRLKEILEKIESERLKIVFNDFQYDVIFITLKNS